MPDNNEMAKERTNWAEDRTILANERTFAGWMRTGMACVAIALGLRALFGPFEPDWVPKLVSSLFICIAVFTFWAARRQAYATMTRLDSHDTKAQPTLYFTVLSLTLSGASIVTGGILWWL